MIQVDFKHTIIILTTNLGSELILKIQAESKKVTNAMARKILLTKFRPEMLNRLDEVIVFSPLTIEDLEQIVEIQVDQLIDRLKVNNGTTVNTSQEVRKFLAQQGYDPEFGARPLKRVIQRELEDVLAYKILDGTIKNGDTIDIRLKDNRISFHRVKTENAIFNV